MMMIDGKESNKDERADWERTGRERLEARRAWRAKCSRAAKEMA